MVFMAYQGVKKHKKIKAEKLLSTIINEKEPLWYQEP